MSESRKNSELPGSWVVEEYEQTGQFNLYAVFKHQDCKKEVHVVPYKTYGLRGFSNAHRVTIESPENGLEVVAEGREINHADEAEKIAIELMGSS